MWDSKENKNAWWWNIGNPLGFFVNVTNLSLGNCDILVTLFKGVKYVSKLIELLINKLNLINPIPNLKKYIAYRFFYHIKEEFRIIGK